MSNGIEPPTEEQLRQERIARLEFEAKAAIESKEYSLAIDKLQAIVALEEGAPI